MTRSLAPLLLLLSTLADSVGAQVVSTLPKRTCAVSDTAYFGGTALADRETWYGKHLRAMSELPLCSTEGAETYRFLWLRSFHAPVAVRVQRQDDRYTLVAKVLSGAGGYEPGDLVHDTSLALTRAQWARFQELLDQAGYWKMPTHVRSNGRDGAQWILEGATDHRYHVVDRWTPGHANESGFAAACLYLLSLSGIVVDSATVY